MSESTSGGDNESPPDKIPIVWVKMEPQCDDSDEYEHIPDPNTNTLKRSVKVEVEVDHLSIIERSDEDEPEDSTREQEKDGDYVETHARPRPKKKRIPNHRNHLKCDFCDYRTSFKNALKFHIMNHTNPAPLSCDQCSYSTKYPNSLQRHILGHQIKDNPNLETPQFKCDECDYVSIFKFNLKAHKRKHSKVKRFTCDECDFGTSYRQSFLKHQRSHQRRMLKESGNYVKEPKIPKFPSVTYQCDKCPFVTKFEGHIARHLAQIHKEVSAKANKCDHCEFATKLKWRLNIHVNRSRQTTPTRCEYCDYVTEYNCAYKLHKRLQHLGHGKAVHETDVFIRIENPSPSLGMVEEPQPPVMDKTQFLLDKDSVEIDWRSIEVIENPGQEKSFQCTHCDYMAKFKASVQRHFQRHHTSNETRPYKCLNCDFCTKTRDQISLHAKRSQSNTILRCGKCEFSTYFKCQFVMHQKCHYPFKCKLCNYTCKQNYDIQRHYSAVHLGNAMKCRFCDFKSARKESLLNHETIHTGIKPFQCGQCDYSAIRRTLLSNHIKKNHYERTVEPVIYDDSKIESLKNMDERLTNNCVSFEEIQNNIIKTYDDFKSKIDMLKSNEHIINSFVSYEDIQSNVKNFDLKNKIDPLNKMDELKSSDTVSTSIDITEKKLVNGDFVSKEELTFERHFPINSEGSSTK